MLKSHDATVQVVQSDSVCKVSKAGSDVREDGTSGDPNQGGLWGRVELQEGETFTVNQ